MGEEKFLDSLKTAIGDEHAGKFQSAILEYAKTENDRTVLMIGARKGHAATVEALLNAGADANGKNKAGETALLVAAFNGHTEAVKTLLTKDADVNAKDNHGVTALMAAAYKGHTSTAEALLADGADVNVRNSKDETALMQAAGQGHGDVLQSLLAKGADATVRSKEGMTALAMAFSKGHTNIVQALLAKATNQNANGSTGANPGSAKAYVIAPDGFLPGHVEISDGKMVIGQTEQQSAVELAAGQIAMIKMDWEQRNLNWYQQGFYVDNQGYIHRWQKIVKVTAEITPKKLEILLRDGRTLVAQLDKVRPPKLDFVTKIDGAEVRLELPLKYFEADYTSEESRRRLTLEAPIPVKGKGWKVKYTMIDFT